MARCEECIHFEVCKHHAKILEGDGYEVEFNDTPEVEKRCAAFKPTADVVEVVRCKDCSFCGGEVFGDIYCRLHDGHFDKEAYCSYGERKE